MEKLNMTNKVYKRQVQGIRLSPASILLVLFCTFLIILATFVQFNITHFILPKGLFQGDALTIKDYLHTYKFIPQIPVIIFVGAFLGKKYGILSILLYIILGLFIIPIFALGGGPKYILEFGFGYILAYIPAVFLADTILQNGFTVKNMLKAVFVGVLVIHIIGILYMLFIAAIRHEGIVFIQGWIHSQSGVKIIYDMILSFGAVFVAKYAKILLWFYM